MDMDTALPAGDDSTDAPLGETGLSALRKLRSECRNLRQRLHACQRERGAIRILAWRPSFDARSPTVGIADIALGDLTVLDVRLLRREGGFILSWPARRPLGSDRLQEIMRPSPALDGRALAAVLETAFPETMVELPA